ncbi:MAG: efflux RND transporter periplasmic adaptor subunit [Opitutales bacterium]
MKPIYWVGPLFILAFAAGLVWLVTTFRPEAQTEVRAVRLPTVAVQPAQLEPVRLTVTSEGNVQPRTETVLTPEVTGRILEVSESFRVGGFFKEGELLMRLDPFDFEVALERARAQLAQSRLALTEEKANAEQARRDWEALGKGEPTDLVLRIPQLARARANVSSDEATLREAQQNLLRTEVRAPYAGRVLEKFVDVGQFVSAGPSSQLARIISIEKAEVRLPLSKDQLALLDLSFEQVDADRQGPPVTIRTRFGDREVHWDGYLERIEGAVDQRTRFFFVVAVVDDPYGSDTEQPGRPPLKPGMFVEAEIQGRDAGNLYVVPRAAMVGNDAVYAIDRFSTLRRRQVETVQGLPDAVLVRSGFEPGDRYLVSPVQFPVVGMLVIAENRPLDASAEDEPPAAATGTVARHEGGAR